MEALALFALIAGVISTLATNASNRSQTNDVMAWNEEMMDKQNAYESPANQAKLLEEAGINTAMLGETNIQSGRSASANPLSAIPFLNPLSEASGGLADLALSYKQGQEGMTESQSRALKLQSIENQNDLFLKQIESAGLNNESQKIALNYADMYYRYAAEGQKADVDLTYSQRANLKAQTAKMRYELENVLPEEVKKIISERNVNVLDLEVMSATIKDVLASANLKSKQSELVGEQITTEGLQQQNIGQDINLKQQQNDYYAKVQDAYLEKYAAEVRNLTASSGLTEEQTYWYLFDEMDKTSASFFGLKVPYIQYNRDEIRHNLRQRYKLKYGDLGTLKLKR